MPFENTTFVPARDFVADAAAKVRYTPEKHMEIINDLAAGITSAKARAEAIKAEILGGVGTSMDTLVEAKTAIDNLSIVIAALQAADSATDADLAELVAALTFKAPLASPNLTGIPTAPTAAPGTNTTQIATMAAVKAAIDALIASAPGALDTLNEIAVRLQSEESGLAALITTVSGKAATVHTHAANDISDSTSIGRSVLTAADAATARTALGVGTGTGDVVGQASSVDSEIAIFDSTTGKLLKRASTTGILKATSGVLAAAVSGTDYAPPTSGSSILKGNGSGGFSSATSGTDYAPATSGTALLKGNGSGGFSNASSGTDYAPATSGTAILKGNGSGGFSSAVAGTDYAGLTGNTFSGNQNIGSGDIKSILGTGFIELVGSSVAYIDFSDAATDDYDARILKSAGSSALAILTPGGGLTIDGNTTLHDGRVYSYIGGLTADSSPDTSADYVMTYDASAGVMKKVLLNLIGGLQIDTNTATTATAYAIGTTIAITGAINRAASATLYYTTGNSYSYQTSSSGGTALTGTWRGRGITSSTDNMHLAQRTA